MTSKLNPLLLPVINHWSATKTDNALYIDGLTTDGAKTVIIASSRHGLGKVQPVVKDNEGNFYRLVEAREAESLQTVLKLPQSNPDVITHPSWKKYTKLHLTANGIPVIVLALFCPAEPDVGILYEYLDDWAIFSERGYRMVWLERVCDSDAFIDQIYETKSDNDYAEMTKYESYNRDDYRSY